MVKINSLRVEVDGHVATLYRDGERVGEWQAGLREYAAAGVEWPGCSCGEESCRHGLAHYWGETLSPAELNALAARSAGLRTVEDRAPRPVHHPHDGEDAMRVVTWQSPSGQKISVCRDCEKRLQGDWPRDHRGEEYATVSHGLHSGQCDVHPNNGGGNA